MQRVRDWQAKEICRSNFSLNKMKERVCVITPIKYPVGGIRTYLKYTYGRLQPDKYSFTLVGPSRSWLERIQADLSDYDIDIKWSGEGESNSAFFSAIFGCLLKKKPDIIHSQGYTAGMFSSAANFVFRFPHVITMHRIFGHDQFSSSFWEKNAAFKRHLIEFFLGRADVVQSVSNDAQANLLEYFPGLLKMPGKARVIRNGINIHEFDKDKGSNIETFSKEPGIFYLGYFGRYMPEKGFPDLIEMVDILVNERNKRNIRLITVGGFGEFIREYQKEIKRRDLWNFFQFLDFFENIGPVLRNVDVLMIPSLSEACPLIPMEGLVCGTPVAAYSCLGLREVLTDTPARMVAVGDRVGLADQVIRIMDSYSRTKAEFDAFVPEARQRFDSIHTARELEAIFKELIIARGEKNGREGRVTQS